MLQHASSTCQQETGTPQCMRVMCGACLCPHGLWSWDNPSSCCHSLLWQRKRQLHPFLSDLSPFPCKEATGYDEEAPGLIGDASIQFNSSIHPEDLSSRQAIVLMPCRRCHALNAKLKMPGKASGLNVERLNHGKYLSSRSLRSSLARNLSGWSSSCGDILRVTA